MFFDNLQLHTVSKFSWRNANTFFERITKVINVIVAASICNLTNGDIGVQKQLLCLFNAKFCNHTNRRSFVALFKLEE